MNSGNWSMAQGIDRLNCTLHGCQGAACGAVQPVQCRALWSPFVGIHTGLACKRGRYAGHGTGCAGHWHGAAIGRAGAPRLLRRRGFALGGRGAEAVAAHCTQQACSATTCGNPGTKSGAPSQLDQLDNMWCSWYAFETAGTQASTATLTPTRTRVTPLFGAGANHRNALSRPSNITREFHFSLLILQGNALSSF